MPHGLLAKLTVVTRFSGKDSASKDSNPHMCAEMVLQLLFVKRSKSF